MSVHTKGLLITVLGMLIISPDTLLIRLIDMDVWSTGFWRGILQALGLIVILCVVYRGRSLAVFTAVGWSGLIIAATFSITTISFIAAIKYTSVANALVILASTPFFAAILSRLFLGEAVALRTWIAIFVAGAGICVIVWDGLGRGTLFGDMMALITAALLAVKLTIVRRQRHINMIPAVALAAVFFAAVSLVMAGGQVAMPDGYQTIYILIMGLAVLAPATALMTLGPRYISTPEVGLIVLLETVLGPIWVWLIIGEQPSDWALIGGTIVVVTLVVHAVVGIRSRRSITATPDLDLAEAPARDR